MTTNEAELSGAALWGRGLRGALAALADLLLPPVCIACRKQTLVHGLLCGACWSWIDFIAPPICARLGMLLPYDTGEPSLSAAAIAEPPVYDRARAAARCSGTMRDLIQSFKYGDRPCARVLKRRGAARVDVLALARAVELSAFLL